MAYNVLKAAIATAIKQNGNNEITGDILQQTLLAMVNSLGANYQFVGIATPTTNPGTPDQNVVYIAFESGTYSNFGGIVVPQSTIGLLIYENGSWRFDGPIPDLNFQAFCNLFGVRDVKRGAAITAGTGAFRSAGFEYKRATFYLPEETEIFVYLPQAGTQEKFWKYTDGTYSTPQSQILARTGLYVGRLTLAAGYYAVSWVSIASSANPIPGEIIVARYEMIKALVNSAIVFPDYAPISSVVPALFSESFTELITFNNSGYITPGGSTNPNSEYRYTDYIPVTYLQKFRGVDFVGTTSVAKVSFYNKNKVITGTPIVTTDTTFVAIVPENAFYVRFCALMYSGSTQIYTPRVYSVDKITELRSFVDDIKLLTNARFPFLGNSLQQARYIADNTGNIGKASIDYRLIKFQVTSPGKFILYASGKNSHPILWEYSDETYSTPVRQLIGPDMTGKIDKIVDLTNGYYAFCYSNPNAPGTGTVVWESEFFILNADILFSRLQEFIDVSAVQQYDFAAIGNDKLTLAGTATRANNQITVSGGNANRAYLFGGFEGQHYTMQARVVMSNGISFVMGKDSSAYGAYIEFLESKLVLHNNPGYQGGYTADYLLGFNLNVGEEYLFSIQFDVTTTKKFKVKIVGQYNEYFEQELEETINGYGNPFFYSDYSALVKEFSLSIQEFYDTRNIKASVWGHSFVEGDSLGSDRIYSFTNLLANAIGPKIVTNFGLGGDTIPAMLAKMANNLPFVRTAKYGFLFIGTNDSSTSATMISGLQQAITALESFGMTPILSTIAPKATGFSTNHRETNAWIRSSGYHYVDMEQVFLSRPATATDLTISDIKTNLLLADGVHPTVQGHLFIFRRIQMDCPFIF